MARAGRAAGPVVASPDGQWTAHGSSGSAGAEAGFRVTRVDGSEQWWIASARPVVSDPAWSPDSRRLAFAALNLIEPGGGEIYVVNIDGTDSTRLSDYAGYHDGLAWSPDGKQLAFTSLVGENGPRYVVHVIGADGAGQSQRVGEGCDPVWAPGPTPEPSPEGAAAMPQRSPSETATATVMLTETPVPTLTTTPPGGTDAAIIPLATHTPYPTRLPGTPPPLSPNVPRVLWLSDCDPRTDPDFCHESD